MIISRTPFRISFFGGGTDYPDWYREHGGAVLGDHDRQILLHQRARAAAVLRSPVPRRLFDRREREGSRGDRASGGARRAGAARGSTRASRFHHDGDLPARSGLGSSSAFTVGLINAVHALDGRHMSKEALASEAIHVEQCVLREPVGLQDQISAAFGGFNHITFRQDGTYNVAPMMLPRERLEALQDHLHARVHRHFAHGGRDRADA